MGAAASRECGVRERAFYGGTGRMHSGVSCEHMALLCVTRGCLYRARTRGRFTPPPIPLTRFVQGRRGQRAFSKHTPPLCSPHGCAPRRRPRGAAPCGFPLGLLLAGGGEKNKRGRQLPLQSPAACACLTLTHSASLAALMLALRSLAHQALVRTCAVFDTRHKIAPMRAARSRATRSHSSGGGGVWYFSSRSQAFFSCLLLFWTQKRSKWRK